MGVNDWSNCGSLAWAAIVFLVIVGILPVLFRRKLIQSHVRLAHRRTSVFRAVKLGDRQDVQAAANHSSTMEDARMRESEMLSPEEITRVRTLRRASIRRRRIIVGVLFAALVIVLVCAAAFHFSPWWALIPAVLLVLVLALGAHASAVARAWERKVATQSFPTPHESDATVVEGSDVSKAIDQRTESVTGTTDKGETGEPTHVIPLPEVRHILQQQAQEKKAEQRQHAQDQAKNKKASASEQTVQPTAQPADAKAKTESASTHGHDADHASSSAKKAIAKASQSGDQVDQSHQSAQSSSPDLISFSLGTSDVTATTATTKATASTVQHTHRHDGRSTRQTDNRAVKPSSAVRRQIFNDVTPSATTLSRVDAPHKSADSLGVDLNAVLARRRQQ